jgi:glycosyltransferase involved in cell wall biosynthesis
MKIAYFSRPYRPSLTQGGNAHIKQFLDIVSANGHEISVSMPDEHPATKVLPAGRFARLLALRSMDVIYCRIEWQPRTQCRLAVNPYRFLSGRAKHVWEFNTVPEYGLLNAASQKEVDKSISLLRQWGQGCDLAVCVSEAIEGYVKEHFKIARTVVAPNGSDPDLFRPDVPSVPPMGAFADKFNVVWIGSADIIWHDLDRIIAAAGLLADVPLFHFHLIGSGVEKFGNHTPQVHERRHSGKNHLLGNSLFNPSG